MLLLLLYFSRLLMMQVSGNLENVMSTSKSIMVLGIVALVAMAALVPDVQIIAAAGLFTIWLVS